jgi:molybdenum cofactor synthesis domain-containing protein
VKVAILTVSDGVSNGTRVDVGGPLARRLVEVEGHEVVANDVVPDEALAISSYLIARADSGDVELVLTTGGTGFAPRDVTPEATRAVIEREAPGIAEAMRAQSLRHTPMGALSRGVAGIRGQVLIVNLPGHPQAIEECLPPMLAPIAHGVDLLRARAIGHRDHPPRSSRRHEQHEQSNQRRQDARS